jgi:hypothetical protein
MPLHPLPKGLVGDRRTAVPATLAICACRDEGRISHKAVCDPKLARTPASRRNLIQEEEVKIVDPEWLRMSSSPGMWIIAFIFAGNALVASFFFYRLAMKTGMYSKKIWLIAGVEKKDTGKKEGQPAND